MGDTFVNQSSKDLVSVVLSQNSFFIFSISGVDSEPMVSMHCDMVRKQV